MKKSMRALSLIVALCMLCSLSVFADSFDVTVNVDGTDLEVIGEVDANGNVTFESINGMDASEFPEDDTTAAIREAVTAQVYDVNAARAAAFGIGDTEDTASGEASGEASGDGSGETATVTYDNYIEESVSYETFTFDGSTYGSNTGFLTVTVEGVEQNPANLKGEYKNVVFTVTPQIPAFVDGYASAYRTALYINSEGVQEDSSVTSAILSGKYDDKSAEDLRIESYNDNFEGLIFSDAEYTIDGLTIVAEGNGTNDFAGVGAGVAVGGSSNVTINNYEFIAHGIIRHGMFIGGDDLANPATLTVNGGIVLTGNPQAEDGTTMYSATSDMSMNSSPWMLGIEPTAEVRSQLMASTGISNYNDVVLISSGWGIVSSDAVDSPANWGEYTIQMNLTDCILDFTGTSGYVSYAIGATHNTFKNCLIGNAIATGALDDTIKYVKETYDYDLAYESGVELDENGDAYNATYALIVANETSGGTFDGSTYTGQYGVMWHKTNNVSYVPGATDNSAKDIPADGYTELIDSTFNTNGAALLIKACTPVINVTNTKFNSKTGVIVQLATCDDPGMGNEYFSESLDLSAPVEADPDYNPYDYNTKNQSIFSYSVKNMINDVQVSFADCTGETALNGDFYNSISVSTTGEGMTWFGQNLILSFDNCEINGNATSSTALHNAYSGYYDAEGNEIKAETLEEALAAGAVEGRITSDNATYLGGMSNTPSAAVNNGVWVLLSNGSVWTPSETCYLTVLDIDETSTVNGTITVDGKAVEEAGHYTGTIVVEPVAVESTSGEASADASAEPAAESDGSSTELADSIILEGVNIMDLFTIDVTLTFEDKGDGVKAFVIEFEENTIPGTISMGVWTPDSGDTNEADICSCVQAAYEAQTGAGHN